MDIFGGPLFTLPHVEKKKFNVIILCPSNYFLQKEGMEFPHEDTYAGSNPLGAMLSTALSFETPNIYRTPKNEYRRLQTGLQGWGVLKTKQEIL